MSAEPALSPSASSAIAPEDRLIVALDVATAAAALELASRLAGTCRWFKVGMELYYAAGNRVVEELRARGLQVFLDLKLHDIPNTVAAAVRSVATCGAGLLTVHAAGGPEMLRAAADAAAEPGSPRLLAVTVLTSMDAGQLAATGVEGSPAEQVLRLAIIAKASGINGCVCSPQEVLEVRRGLGQQMLLVVPGIRPAGDAAGDQRRVATPAEAMRDGASMLVVGRPITRAADPAEAAARVLDEMRRSPGTV